MINFWWLSDPELYIDSSSTCVFKIRFIWYHLTQTWYDWGFLRSHFDSESLWTCRSNKGSKVLDLKQTHTLVFRLNHTSVCDSVRTWLNQYNVHLTRAVFLLLAETSLSASREMKASGRVILFPSSSSSFSAYSLKNTRVEPHRQHKYSLK